MNRLTDGGLEPEDDGNVVIGPYSSRPVCDHENFIPPVMDVDRLSKVECLRNSRKLNIIHFLLPVEGDYAPATSILSEANARDDTGHSMIDRDVKDTSYLHRCSA